MSKSGCQPEPPESRRSRGGVVGHLDTNDEVLFRLGLVAAIGSALLFVLTAWALYVLLREVNEVLALLLLVLNAIGVAVQCASYLPLLAVLARGDAVGLTGPQLDGLSMLSVTTHQSGFVMA